MKPNPMTPSGISTGIRQPVKVAYIGHTAKLGGAEIGLLRMLSRVDRSSVTPLVILAEQGPFVEKLREEQLEVIVLQLAGTVAQLRKDSLDAKGFTRPAVVARTVGYSIRLAQLLRQQHVDIVHTNTLKSNCYGLLAARLAGKPIIWHIRDNIDESYLPPAAVKLIRVLARRGPDFVVTCSDSVQRNLPSSSSRIQTIYDGLSEIPDTNRIEHDPFELPLIGIVGRLAPWKGQDIFIQAASLIKNSGIKARYVIIGAALFGEDAFVEELRRLADACGLSEDIEFTGFVDDVGSQIRKMSVLVHASISPEPLGQVVIEGLAHGVPVVATAAGGPIEILANGEYGLLTTPGSASSLSEAVIKILSDRDLASRLSANGPIRVKEAFNAEENARQIAQLYTRVLNLSPSK